MRTSNESRLTSIRRKTERRGKRRAVAITEFAITLPVFVLILLGTIEATSMIFLKQSMKIAAYEGARTALVPGASADNVQAATDLLLAARGVDGATVTISPSDFATQPYGTTITVQVSAACSSNSLVSPWFYQGKTLVADVSMMKEN